MATSSITSPVATPTDRPARDRRVTIFRVVAGIVSVGLLFGAMIVFFMLAPWTLIGPEPEGYAAEIHRWHHADVGALFGFLVSGALLATIAAPRHRTALVQSALVALGSLLVASAIDELSLGAIAIPLVVMAIIVAAYPRPRALLSLRGEAPASLPLLGLTLAAAVPLLLNAWDNLRMQAEDHSQHAAEGHWSGSAAVAIALVLIGLLVAIRRPGWHILGALLGVTYLYLGVAALTIPDHDGSWGVLGGGLALLAGAACIALVVVEGRRGDAATAPQAA